MDTASFDALLADLRRIGAGMADSTLGWYASSGEDEQFMARLCDGYWLASAAQRQALYQAAGEFDGMLNHLLGYVYQAASQLRAPADLFWLRRGLAAISLEGRRLDYRDTIMAHDRLSEAAQQAGVDIKTTIAIEEQLVRD